MIFTQSSKNLVKYRPHRVPISKIRVSATGRDQVTSSSAVPGQARPHVILPLCTKAQHIFKILFLNLQFYLFLKTSNIASRFKSLKSKQRVNVLKISFPRLSLATRFPPRGNQCYSFQYKVKWDEHKETENASVFCF